MSSPLYQSCVDQGNVVRDLKTAKASKDEITAAVAKLLKLKEDYKAATGQDYKPPAGGAAPRDTKTAAQKPKKVNLDSGIPGSKFQNQTIWQNGINRRLPRLI